MLCVTLIIVLVGCLSGFVGKLDWGWLVVMVIVFYVVLLLELCWDLLVVCWAFWDVWLRLFSWWFCLWFDVVCLFLIWFTLQLVWVALNCLFGSFDAWGFAGFCGYWLLLICFDWFVCDLILGLPVVLWFDLTALVFSCTFVLVWFVVLFVVICYLLGISFWF